jgi:hypothetical protein
MPVESLQPESRIVLHGISWSTFEALLAASDNRGARFTYDQDISASSLDQLKIYAALGVPEVWMCDGAALKVFRLQPGGDYVLQTRSPTFPFLPLEELERFLARRDETDETTWIRSFRAWVNTLPT